MTTPAAVAPPVLAGNTMTAQLSVAASDGNGTDDLTYTWVAMPTTTDPDAPPPALSDNGTSTAWYTTATFAAAGQYQFTVTITDPGGISTSSGPVNVEIDATPSGIAVSPMLPAGVTASDLVQFSAVVVDQFGNPLPYSQQPPPSDFDWTAASGQAFSTTTGLYQAPSGGVTDDKITVTYNDLSGATAVNAVPPIRAFPALAMR